MMPIRWSQKVSSASIAFQSRNAGFLRSAVTHFTKADCLGWKALSAPLKPPGTFSAVKAPGSPRSAQAGSQALLVAR